MTEHSITERYVDQRVRLERESVVRRTAVDAILRREVLLTQLTGSIGRRAAAQDAFRESAEAAMRLSHPNIVATYDVDSANGYPYVVQEHMQSETLRSIIDAEKPFHPDDVSVLISAIADALSYARLRGMPHLALTPDRIVVDFDGTVLVTDFGIGKVLNDLEPPDPADSVYLAPELAEAESGDARSDIYSAGAIAYEMLTGTPPRVGENGRIPSPSSLNPDVPADVATIVMMALESRPEDRFRSIEALAAALEDRRTLIESPPSAEEPPPQFRELEPDLALPDEPTVEIRLLDDQDDEPEPGTGRTTAILAWCGLALGVLALGWVVASFLTGDDGSDPEITRVANGGLSTSTVVAQTAPDLLGLTVEQAEDEAGIAIMVTGSRADESAPSGQIVEQLPEAGQPVGSDGISVVLSSGPSPNLLDGLEIANRAFEDVTNTLTQLGLNVARQDERSTDVAEGFVIATVETEAQAGDTITVRVSMGDRVQIPIDLQSQPVEDVTEVLEGLGLTVNEPIAVSATRIESAGVDLTEFSIEDGDVVGIQEENAGFGQWVAPGSSVTPVYYDASIP